VQKSSITLKAPGWTNIYLVSFMEILIEYKLELELELFRKPFEKISIYSVILECL
jgi:hypothetical protein